MRCRAGQPGESLTRGSGQVHSFVRARDQLRASGPRGWQLECEGRSLLGAGRIGEEFATLSSRKAAGDGETDPAATGGSVESRYAVEAVEHTLEVLDGKTDACVGDRDSYDAALVGSAHGDQSPGGRVTERIPEQIGEDLYGALLVDDHANWIIELDCKRDGFAVELRSEAGCDRARELREIGDGCSAAFAHVAHSESPTIAS